MQGSLEVIKQVVEENHVLIQEMQESVDEHRINEQRRRNLQHKNEVFTSAKETISQVKNIDHYINHLLTLHGSFKSYLRLALENSMILMLTSNLLPIYSVLSSFPLSRCSEAHN